MAISKSIRRPTLVLLLVLAALFTVYAASAYYIYHYVEHHRYFALALNIIVTVHKQGNYTLTRNTYYAKPCKAEICELVLLVADSKFKSVMKELYTNSTLKKDLEKQLRNATKNGTGLKNLPSQLLEAICKELNMSCSHNYYTMHLNKKLASTAKTSSREIEISSPQETEIYSITILEGCIKNLSAYYNYYVHNYTNVYCSIKMDNGTYSTRPFIYYVAHCIAKVSTRTGVSNLNATVYVTSGIVDFTKILSVSLICLTLASIVHIVSTSTLLLFSPRDRMSLKAHLVTGTASILLLLIIITISTSHKSILLFDVGYFFFSLPQVEKCTKAFLSLVINQAAFFVVFILLYKQYSLICTKYKTFVTLIRFTILLIVSVTVLIFIAQLLNYQDSQEYLYSILADFVSKGTLVVITVLLTILSICIGGYGHLVTSAIYIVSLTQVCAFTYLLLPPTDRNLFTLGVFLYGLPSLLMPYSIHHICELLHESTTSYFM